MEMSEECVEAPDWKDMPEPHALCTLSWQDIYCQAVNSGYSPTVEDIKFMMHWLGPTEFDCNCDYNAWIEIKVQQYFEDIKKK